MLVHFKFSSVAPELLLHAFVVSQWNPRYELLFNDCDLFLLVVPRNSLTPLFLVRPFYVQVLWLWPCECPKLVISVPARERGTSRRAHRLLSVQRTAHAIPLWLLQLPVLSAVDQELRLGHPHPNQSEPGEGQGAEDAKAGRGRLIPRIFLLSKCKSVFQSAVE